MMTQKKKATGAGCMEELVYAAINMFFPGLWVMWGAGALGWHWGYWHAWVLENAVTTPLAMVAFSAIRYAKKED
jgi:hypothetical protein